MKKNFLLLVAGCMAFSSAVLAQKSETGFSDANTVVVDGKALKRSFKPENPTENKSSTVDVTGAGVSSFTASNTSDGSPDSYKHKLQITVALTTTSKTNTFQLVFYSENTSMPYAVQETAGLITIYYPISVYSDIREKLEQSLAAKKKVQIKVQQQTNGYKEGTIIF